MNKKEETMIVDKELETTTDEFIIDFYYLYTLENETDDINVAVDSVYKYNIKTTKEQVKKIIELYEKDDEFEDDGDSIL